MNRKNNKIFQQLGCFPISGKMARKEKKIYLIRKEETLRFIQEGYNGHLFLSFYVSNDFLHIGKLTIPAGIFSKPERHGGDEIIYCLKGNISVLIYDKDQDPDSITKKRLEAKQGERVFVPKGVSHQYYNFETFSSELIFTIAPNL